MSVSLSPNRSLEFTASNRNPVSAPLVKTSRCTLNLTNHHKRPTTFKIKTSKPKGYFVRPNRGRIEPGKSVVAVISRRALPEETPLDAVCRDKFLVESSIVPAKKSFQRLRKMMGCPEKDTEPPQLHKQKLKVKYLLVDDKGTLQDGTLRSQPSTSALDQRSKSRPSTTRSSYSSASRDIPPAYAASERRGIHNGSPQGILKGDNLAASSARIGHDADSSRIAELSAKIEAANREIEGLKGTVEAMKLQLPQPEIMYM
ncbi:PapD-like protein [Lyophyllum atratum]|nr:PapD-like protein [Lyophyllum atratum]